MLAVTGVPGVFLTLAFLKQGDTASPGWLVGLDLAALVCIWVIVLAWRGRKTRRAVITADALGGLGRPEGAACALVAHRGVRHRGFALRRR